MKEFLKNELTGWKKIEIAWLISASVIIAILSISLGDNAIGLVMAITGVICVILTGKGKMSCYLFGLVNTLLYAYISFGAKYYGEVMLNLLYYVPMQFIGWFMWKKHINQETKEVKKRRLTFPQELILLAVSLCLVYGYGLVLKMLGGSLPFIDSMSTCLSVLAMILSVKRYMEQWILWIVIDLVTVYMWFVNYAQGGTDAATLFMWLLYLLNAVFMLVKWSRESDV